MVGAEREGFLEHPCQQASPRHAPAGRCQIVARRGVVRLDGQRLLKSDDRLVQIPLLPEQGGEQEVRFGLERVVEQGQLQLALGEGAVALREAARAAS